MTSTTPKPTDVTCSKLFFTDWIRCAAKTAQGLYWHEPQNPGYGWKMYPENRSEMTFQSGQGNGGIRGSFWDSSKTGGFIHWTTGREIGFQNPSREWSLRCDGERNVEIFGTCTAPAVNTDVVKAQTLIETATVVASEVKTDRLSLNQSTLTNRSDGTVALDTPKNFVVTSGGQPDIRFDLSQGIVTASKFAGDASLLTNVQGANVQGTVPRAQNASTAQQVVVSPGQTSRALCLTFADNAAGDCHLRTSRGLTFDSHSSRLGVGVNPSSLHGIRVHGSASVVGDVTSINPGDFQRATARPVSDALERIRHVQGYVYDALGRSRLALDPDEVAQQVPEAVYTVDNERAIAYDKLVVVLLEALKEAHDRLLRLEDRIQSLEPSSQ